MEQIVIRGPSALNGTVRISGAKNAVLPLMAAALLTDQPLRLENIPDLVDIRTLGQLLTGLGADVKLNAVAASDAGLNGSLNIDARNITNTTAPYDLVRRMRASILVLGPLLARCGEALVSLPGGCAIGTRPVDLHLQGLEALGAKITLDNGYIHATAPKGLTGGLITLPFVSVGATENLLMAATLATGDTILRNAAREPEIVDLGVCLQAMGARIEGLGTAELRIQGVSRLNGVTHRVIPDRIETGTYAIAAAITGSKLTLAGAQADLSGAVLDSLAAIGVGIEPGAEQITVDGRANNFVGCDITTAPFPGFPTDMQAQMMAMMTQCTGVSSITETIFENRFMHVSELRRLGADIRTNGGTAQIFGPCPLKGAPVMATDLRASVSLILAGLAAEGETIVNRVYHLDRGYAGLVEKLARCGADITRVTA